MESPWRRDRLESRPAFARLQASFQTRKTAETGDSRIGLFKEIKGMGKDNLYHSNDRSVLARAAIFAEDRLVSTTEWTP
ncbi:hypothetical protein BVL52_02225 [Pseudomonas oryzihabitans]|uniref:Uncharacterized protein n=1 Tax=Pseudomonas oryzihabitans TaxID=47885 RepID=A0ABX3J054_9PSED|nr:hypothetical protein BVL52_02225 [Pseudomonas psychrotolerans]RAU36766.1 hypothetical protein DBY63_016655 [Pseudomonas sp. RIT 411]